MSLQSLLKFDQRMVDFLQSICHKQQKFLGLSHYFWLRLFAMAHAVICFVLFLPTSQPSNHYKIWILIASFLVCIPALIWWERRSINRLLKGFANPLRKNPSFIYFRYLVGYITTSLFVLLGITVTLLNIDNFWLGFRLIIWWTTFASLYVLPACDPLPPSMGTLQKWVLSKVTRPVPC